jgi:hypothetical protein
MAESLQPRSALTPPRSPAPINATRPDFPVRAGSLFLLENLSFSASDLQADLQA